MENLNKLYTLVKDKEEAEAMVRSTHRAIINHLVENRMTHCFSLNWQKIYREVGIKPSRPTRSKL